MRRAITVVVAVVFAVAGLATLDNALTPAAQLAFASTGPAALSVVRSFEVDPKTNMAFAGTNAGVFRSADRGVTWVLASHGLPGADVQDLLFAPKTNTLYAVLFGVGLFRSQDDGQNWEGIGRGLNGAQLLTLALDDRTGIMYAGLAGYGMYTSTDGGANWLTIGFGVSNTNIHALLVGQQAGEIFAATDAGVYHSTNVTDTWDLLTGEARAVSAWSLAMDPKSGTVYAGTEHGVLAIQPNNGQFMVNLTGLTQGTVGALVIDPHTGNLHAGTLSGVQESADGGATWSPHNQGLTSSLVRAMLLLPEDAGWLAGTDSGIFHGTDGASDWRPATLSPAAQNVQALLVNGPDGTLFAGTLGGGVFRSTDDGAQWQPVNDGLGNTVVQALGVDHGANALYAGTRGGIYSSPINAIHWTLASPKLAGVNVQTVAVDERHGNVYAVDDYGDVLRSGKGGAEWAIVQPLQRVFARTVTVSSFASTVFMGAYKGGVMASRDFGFTWRPLGNIPIRNVEALAVDERNGTLYAGTLGGAVFSITDDRGGGWQKSGDTLPGDIVALTVDQKTGAVFAALKAGLFRLAEGESTWMTSTTGLSLTNALALTANNAGDQLYAGVMSGGAYRSSDSGATWTAISTGLTDVEMRGIVADDASGALDVSITDRGIFRSEDGGKTWHSNNVGLNELAMRGVSADRAGLYGLTTRTITINKGNNNVAFEFSQAAYQLPGGSPSWQPQAAPLNKLRNVIDLLLPINAYGVAGRLPGGDLLWAERGGGELWGAIAASTGLGNGTVRELPDGRSQLFAVWGAELARTEPGPSYSRVPLAWMIVRTWAWAGQRWLAANAQWWWWAIAGSVIALLILLGLLGRVRLSRRFGVPLGVAVFMPGRSANLARVEELDKSWPKWERAVQSELYRYGDVTPVDLPSVPGPFRMYAMQRYAQTHDQQRSVELQGNRLHAAKRDQMRLWVDAWQAVRGTMRRQGVSWKDRRHVDQLAAALAGTLGLQATAPLDVDAVRAYALQGAGPRTLALLFVADNEALSHTVHNLADALDATRVPGITGIVFSLGRPGRDIDVTNQVRAAVGSSEFTARLVVLTYGDALDVMSASDTLQALTQRLQARSTAG